MFFSDDEHQLNYKRLMRLYELNPGSDRQYEANIYIAAYPDIYEGLNIDKIKTSEGGPLIFLLFDEYADDHKPQKLTGSTTRLAEVGMSLYNGYQVSLDEVFGSITNEEMLSVFLQACRIRAFSKISIDELIR